MSSQVNPMNLYVGEFGPVRVFGRALIIVCAYRGGTRKVSWLGRLRSIRYVRTLVNLVARVPLGSHRAVYRDHYANPRRLEVQLGLVRALLAQGRTEHVTTILDARLSLDESQQRAIAAHENQTVDLAGWAPVVGEVDTIVLVYPDALGLTFSGLERRLLSAGARNVVVVTGRRRLFPLSSPARRALRWRRFLAWTRIVELAAAVVIVPLAAVLAGYDRLTAASRSGS